MSKQKYSKEELYRAHLTRDHRFDGKFFVAVKTTGIYCRPICPARKAKLQNLSFFLHASQAEAAGFRPCLRCRPETAPGSAAWIGTSAVIRRAVRLMETQAQDPLAIKTLSEQLGIGERWLRSLFQQELGTNPKSFLLNRKLGLAQQLLDNRSLTITEVALNSGFNSIRRFNDAFKKKFGTSPSQYKKSHQTHATHTLLLAYRPPLDWQQLLNFFAKRTLPGMETVQADTYQRLITYKGSPGWLKASQATGNKIRIDFKLEKPSAMLDWSTRIRELFDLDADPMSIERDLARDQNLKPLLKAHPGLRVPGCWDPFELATRAIIGQRISVKAARTCLIRLLEQYGEPQNFDTSITLKYFFPSAKKILHADLSAIGLTRGKIHTLKALSQALVENKIRLDGTEDHNITCKKLLAIKGIGPWTVEYIAMRSFKNPDAFPESDLEIQKQLKAHQLNPELWRPWRAYGSILLFSL